MLWRPLRTDTDRNAGRGPPEQNRQTGTMAELGTLEAMAVQGALKAMAELGALEAMADGLRGPWPRPPRPGPYSRNSTTPPQNFHGEVRGYQEPSGARQTGQNMTGQPSRARQTGHDDRTALQGQTDRTR